MKVLKNRQRTYGEHLTSIGIFKKFILPEIEKEIYNYRWVDLFCGEGNLILPILELVPENKRIEFFKKHIFLFDIQKELVEKSILNALKYGIPKEIAKKILFKETLLKITLFLF